MPSPVFVQVVGFRDVERHALNTVFRLSRDRATTYLLWSPDAPAPAHLALIDVDSYEGAMALASPEFSPYVKTICVGERPPESAWRVFNRPLNWHAVVGAMDELFAPVSGHGLYGWKSMGVCNERARSRARARAQVEHGPAFFAREKETSGHGVG